MQSKHRYKELQARLDATRSSGSGPEQQQLEGTRAEAGEACGQASGHQVARTGTCTSPRAATASAAATRAVAGLPRAVVQQQQQQQQTKQEQDPAKRLRAVQKKLRQIAALEQRQLQGREQVELLPGEAAKLQQRGQLEAEAQQLQALVRQGLLGRG